MLLHLSIHKHKLCQTHQVHHTRRFGQRFLVKLHVLVSLKPAGIVVFLTEEKVRTIADNLQEIVVRRILRGLRQVAGLAFMFESTSGVRPALSVAEAKQGRSCAYVVAW